MEVADLAEILPENVIISYNKKRVFSSASPHGIGVWAEAELEACDKNTYEYIRSNPTRAPSLVPQDLHEITNIHRPLSPTIEEPEYKSPEPESQPEKEEDDDKFKLILRGKDVKDVTLTVRPTTKCSAIIKAFLKSVGLTEKFTASAAPPPPAKGRGRKKAAPPVAAVPPMPQLVVDGDKLDPESEIREADLEDGDMVEVSGL
ncbi:hypothetical protein QCA50_006941 [Cerrena zonata]|uniref:Rad60/SUMO-like domain-containing protein n=1 Tax=Cerrena zonata TaxID=2478898 RepID=A0AAW0GL32_9APHY